MSEMERNKGRLIPADIDTEHYTDDDYDTLWENNFVVIDGEVYSVEWEVERDSDCCGFADVAEGEYGTISFHTYHYNGGAHWTEVVEYVLKGREKYD